MCGEALVCCLFCCFTPNHCSWAGPCHTLCWLDWHSLLRVLLHILRVVLQPALRGGALQTIEQRNFVTTGPLQLVQGNFGTVARMPVFIRNSTLDETFGTNKTCGCSWHSQASTM